MNADRTQAFLALAPIPSSGPLDTATTDLFFAPVQDGVIGGRSMFGGINSTTYDSYPTITRDLQHLIYGSKRSGAQRLNIATAVDHSFDAPTLATLDLVPGVSSNEPYALGSSDVLYFEADHAKSDIYRAAGGPTAFTDVAPVASLDTADRENAPVVTDDELEVFFASDRASPGRPNLSGLDIYTAARGSPSADFAAPVMVPGLSTVDQIDYPLWISADNCELFYINKIDAVGSLYVTRR